MSSPLVVCPQCQSQMMAKDAATGFCPVCAHSLGATDTPSQKITPARPAATEYVESKRKISKAVLLTLAGIAIVGGFVLAPWVEKMLFKPEQPENNGRTLTVQKQTPEKKAPEKVVAQNSTPTVQPAESAKEPTTTQPSVVNKTEPMVPATDPNTPPVVKATPAENAAEPVKPQDQPVIANVDKPAAPPAVVEDPLQRIILDRPNEEYVLTKVDGKENLVLTGRVKTLVIEEVNGEGQVDTTQLQVEKIILKHGTNGRSKLKLSAPNGVVEFQGTINGESNLDIQAPGGRIVFEERRATNHGGGEIGGASRLNITAQEVIFDNAVNGGSRVDVTLTKAGRMKFTKMDGGANMIVHKVAVTDPELDIQKGEILGGAKLKVE